MKTFLKWAGNKTSVVDKIAPFLIGDTLIEPFAGSCAVSLNSSFNNYICNDINEDMINMFKLVQNKPHDYITKVKEYFNNGNDSDKYYELRKLYNHPVWSSPKAVIACKNLNLSYIPKKDSIGRNKKLTHLEALILLSKKAKKTLDDFIKLDSTESFRPVRILNERFQHF